ncbi:hypothetical protein [Streptosporangium sp. NPDC049078]|uniref:hypothetical protein n=1 Tax=Streptosporangium sp. NPDC049078 TaxID=3155767 RepID=UPI003412E8EC
MTTPAPPAPDAGQPPAAPPAQAPPAPTQAPTSPQAPAPQTTPPVPQPPTWTPPAPTQVDDGGIDDIGKLPKKWQKELTDARSDAAKYRVQARTETVLRHAYTTATEHGVNPQALLGSTVFAEHAKQLDPSAEDFPVRLAETIQAALKANPWMAAQQTTTPPPPPVPPQSGGDFTGSGGHQTQSLDEQIADAEKSGNHRLAITLKRQKAALNQPQ